MEINEVRKRLAQAVLEERTRRELTQAELAKQVKISVRTLQKIEKAEAYPEYKTLYRLVRALYLDPNQILLGVESEISPIRRQFMMTLLECNEKEREFLIELSKGALEAYRAHIR